MSETVDEMRTEVEALHAEGWGVESIVSDVALRAGSDIRARAAAIHALIPLVEAVEDPIERRMYADLMRDRFEVPWLRIAGDDPVGGRLAMAWKRPTVATTNAELGRELNAALARQPRVVRPGRPLPTIERCIMCSQCANGGGMSSHARNTGVCFHPTRREKIRGVNPEAPPPDWCPLRPEPAEDDR